MTGDKPIKLVIPVPSNPPVLRLASAAADMAWHVRCRASVKASVLFVPCGQDEIHAGQPLYEIPYETRAAMLQSLIGSSGLDAKISDALSRDGHPETLAGLLEELSKQDPGYDYMPCAGLYDAERVAAMPDRHGILSKYGMAVACGPGASKVSVRKMLRAEPSHRVWASCSASLDDAERSSDTALGCLAEGDWESVARECGYGATKILDEYISGKRGGAMKNA